MDSKKSANKITEIVRLQQILKKWKKLAAINNAPKNNAAATISCTTGSGSSSSMNNNNNSSSSSTTSKSIKFLKKTLSFSESSSSSSCDVVVIPKGYLAVCVGKELKRFVIPMEYLGHQAFGILLREAEEEFGFQQEGVLKIPCQVPVFEKILKMMEDKKTDSPTKDASFHLHDFGFTNNTTTSGFCYFPPDCDELTASSHTHHHQPPQMCR